MTTKRKKQRELTLKQKRWIEAYLQTGNATEAARQAGYSGSKEVLAEVGWQNVRKVQIRERIAARVAEAQVSTDEVIGTLAAHLRADVTELLSDSGHLDVDLIREKKLGHLIKKIKTRRYIERNGDDAEPVEVTEVELHNSQTAAIQLCKVLGIEQEPAKNRSDLARQMLEKLTRSGLSEDDAIASLISLGVDPADLNEHSTLPGS